MRQQFYNLLIFTVIIFKFAFLISTIAFKYFKYNKVLDDDTLNTMQSIKEQFLTVSEVFMYIVLLIIFSPHRKSVDIKLSKKSRL